MFRVPTEKWTDKERLKWMISVALGVRWNQFTWDPPSVGANSTVDTTLTAASNDVRLTGLRIGMPVNVTPPGTLNAGLAVGGSWVAANDSITIRLVNVTAAPIDAPSSTWSYFGVIL
jgi:hypothetical protein